MSGVSKMKIKKNDPVVVITGKYKGKQGIVEKVFPKDSRVLVSGVNVAKSHQKPSAAGAGGVIEKELPIHISNVAYYDATVNKATKVSYRFLGDGKKVRIAKASGEQLV
jgi:large subunit ribosomal protein L24